MKSNAPRNFGVVLFDGFQAMDAFGPLDVLSIFSNMAGAPSQMCLSILSATLDPVPTLVSGLGETFRQMVVPTHTFDTAPENIEVLLVPGGRGTRSIEATQPAVDYIKATYPKLRYLLTVCTGSALVARTGLLDGKSATSNKMAFQWVRKLVHRRTYIQQIVAWRSTKLTNTL